MTSTERGAIWDRFLAESAPEPAPVVPGPGSAGFPWRLFALPAAAGLVAVLAWGAGLFDGDPPSPVPDNGERLQAHAGDPGPTIFQQAPVIQAVFATDRQFRQRRGSSRPDAEYPVRLRRALDGESMATIWFDGKRVTSREAKLEEIERILADCSSGGVEAPELPEKAHIEASCVHEVRLEDGTTMRVPHVMFCCDGKKLSAYFLCGSLRPAVEKAMKRCASLAEARLAEGRTTKLHQCRECG